MEMVIARDLPSDVSGKTWKEKNMELRHNIPITALVELETGVRLFVVRHTRDCDGTPLYVVSADIDAVADNARNPLIDKLHGGYSESCLREISPKPPGMGG